MDNVCIILQQIFTADGTKTFWSLFFWTQYILLLCFFVWHHTYNLPHSRAASPQSIGLS